VRRGDGLTGEAAVHKRAVGLAGAIFVLIAWSGQPNPAVGAAPIADRPSVPELVPTGETGSNALDAKRRAGRLAAVSKVLNGQRAAERRGSSTVARMGTKRAASGRAGDAGVARVDDYVELSREATDRIFVVLAEFGDERHPSFPDQDTDPRWAGPVRFDGPSHNQIPRPDRTKDNWSSWRPDYSRDFYQQLYFGTGPGVESVKTFYEQQSSGRYSVEGTVTDWVRVRYNQARYGRSNGFPCAFDTCSNQRLLVPEALNAWVASQQAQGRTDAQVRQDLQSFDVWDRYDHDGDGDFNEPDGYLDHFQVVKAGASQSDLDKVYGEDAIWAHRGYSSPATIGSDGPPGNKLGGSQIGTTGLWVGDYTMQGESSSPGTFVHEYAHDLGLPDLYDFKDPGTSPVAWWSLMSQTRLSAAGDEGIGTRMPEFGAWDKLQLGWLDYEVVKAGQDRTIELGPHEYNSAKAQGVVVVLPRKKVVTPLARPVEGARAWWSGKGDRLTSTLTRQVTLPADSATLTFQAWWDIEDCGTTACDYAFVEVDNGAGFTAIAGSITKAAEANGIDGTSNGWVPATFDLSAFAGRTIGLRLRYVTDGNTVGRGFLADDIRITAGDVTVLADGAESGTNGWTASGFTTVGESATEEFDNYYVASNRTWLSYDRYLRTGPYNFGFGPEHPDLVERFPYQEGLLVSYWDTSQSDNSVSLHPGEGLILPIDSRPELVYRLDGRPWPTWIQGYDAPFSLRKADSFALHYRAGKTSYIRGQNGVAQFDDSRPYYREDPAAGIHYGVKVPRNGVKIGITGQNGTSMSIRVFAARPTE
jgi:immune inhibitor A